jgi:hypothetical protein
MRLPALCAALFLALPASVLADNGHEGNGNNSNNLRASLAGENEVPSVNTVASGMLQVQVAHDQQSFNYTLTFSGLQGTVTQSHIHIAQKAVNGSIVIWLCQTATNPAPVGAPPTCPAGGGTVTGTVTSADVIAGSTASQQLKAGDLADALRLMREGFAYANVHSSLSPGGEIRGQIRNGD